VDGLLASIIIGGLAGWLAQYLLKDDAPFGIIGNILLGIFGGAVGGFLFDLLGLSASGLIGQLVVAVIEAIIILYIIQSRSSRTSHTKLKAVA